MHREPVGNGAGLVDGRSHQTVTEPDPIPVDSEETCLHCRLEIAHHRRLGASGGRGSEQSAEWNIVTQAAASSNRRVGAGRSDIRAVNDATISSPTGIQSGVGPG